MLYALFDNTFELMNLTSQVIFRGDRK